MEYIAILLASSPIIAIACYTCYVWGFHVGTEEIFEIKEKLKEQQ